MNSYWVATTGFVMLLAIILVVWGGHEAYKCGYNEGKDAGYSEALSLWIHIQPEIQWHSTELFLIKDNEVDEYVLDLGWHPPLLWPIHHVYKPWTPYKLNWREQWIDTSVTWHPPSLSPALIQEWYPELHEPYDTGEGE